MKYVLALAAALFVMGSCEQRSKEDGHASHQMHGLSREDTLSHELMETHDSLMALMPKIMELQMRLKSDAAKLDSNLASKSKVIGLAAALDSADHAMMDWMHRYKADTLAKLEDNAARAYVDEQTARILVVQQRLNESLLKAEAYLVEQKSLYSQP